MRTSVHTSLSVGQARPSDIACMGDKTVVEKLREHGFAERSELMKAAKRGLIADFCCAMEVCFHPDSEPDHYPEPNPAHRGREGFDHRSQPAGLWEPTGDHYPILKKDGGKVVQLGHRFCNWADWQMNPKHAEARAEVDAINAAAGAATLPATSSSPPNPIGCSEAAGTG